jgi:hypothetical protein
MANSFIILFHLLFDISKECRRSMVSIVVNRKRYGRGRSIGLRFTSVRRCARMTKTCNGGKRARLPTRSETANGKSDIF